MKNELSVEEIQHIISTAPFLILDVNIGIAEYLRLYVLVKENDGTRRVYSHVPYANGKTHVDDEPLLHHVSDEYEMSNLELKRKFLLEYAYSQGRKNSSDKLVWCNGLSIAAYQEKFFTGKEEALNIILYNRDNPGTLVKQLQKIGQLLNPSRMEYYKWQVTCPIPESYLNSHQLWIDAEKNEWHCEKCNVHGDNIQPWLDKRSDNDDEDNDDDDE
jgi:hypothetical protein